MENFLKIGINAFGCNHGRSGIGAYIYSLIHNLPEMKHSVYVFGPQFDKYIYTTDLDPSMYDGITIEDDEFSEKLFAKTSMNQLVNKLEYDAVLFPAGLQNLPLSFAKSAFLVIQEPIKKNTNFSIFNSISQLGQKNILQKASGLIASSNYIKNNLISFGISEEKIEVIYNGIDTNIFFPKTSEDDTHPENVPFVIRKPYIIYASSISEPEKRHLELIKGFEIFKQNTGLPHRLVIAGQEGKVAKNIHKAVLSSSAVSDIILAGYIEQAQLAHFYRESDICVFPSEIEGVGLPVIESMACGIPTACAEAGAIPEIAGDAALYFDAKKPADIANALEKLASNPKESTEELRNELIEKGLNWVKRYSWKNTAEKTFGYIFRKLKEKK
ncbi:MAG: glycosyltransferase family 1 protein [Treponemataceae bacterium]